MFNSKRISELEGRIWDLESNVKRLLCKSGEHDMRYSASYQGRVSESCRNCGKTIEYAPYVSENVKSPSLMV